MNFLILGYVVGLMIGCVFLWKGAFRCRKFMLFPQEGIPTKGFRPFIWKQGDSLVLELVGISEEADGIAPVYLPLISWAWGTRGIILEFFLDIDLSLVVAFFDHWPFVKMDAVTNAEDFEVVE